MTGYKCLECDNETEFERILEIKEPFEYRDGEWQEDHSREEVLDVLDVTCAVCGGDAVQQ